MVQEIFMKFLIYFNNVLTGFTPMFHFYTPWKRQKIVAFLPFSGGIEMEHWCEMG